jgi:hypothetical protein
MPWVTAARRSKDWPNASLRRRYLANLVAPTLTLACAQCDRRGVYSVARLQAKHGDARLTDLRSFLTADCPERERKSIHAQCKALFGPPPETRREKPTW